MAANNVPAPRHPTQAVRQQGTTGGHYSRSLLLVFVGCALFLWGVMGSLVQIQTTEAFLLGARTASFIPNWEVLHQPVLLMQGIQAATGAHTSPSQITSDQAMSYMGGWAIELVFLAVVVALDVCLVAIRGANKHLVKFFLCAVILIVMFDLYTDYLYGHLGSGQNGQILFALVMGVVVTFFNVAGIALIEFGIKIWGK